MEELESRLSLKDDEWKEVVAEREEELRRQWERRMMDVKAQLSTVCAGECMTCVCVSRWLRGCPNTVHRIT